jgi:hypothetical protein
VPIQPRSFREYNDGLSDPLSFPALSCREDFQVWPTQESHQQRLGPTLVAVPIQRETLNQRDYRGEQPRPGQRTHSAKHVIPLDSADVPFTAKSEYTTVFTGKAAKQYTDTIPATAHAPSMYLNPYVSDYMKNFTRETADRAVRSRPDPRHKEHVSMPDTRVFVSDYKGNFVHHPTTSNGHDARVWPNPPCIQQIYVQENMRPLSPGEAMATIQAQQAQSGRQAR